MKSFLLRPPHPGWPVADHKTCVRPTSFFLASEIWVVKIGCPKHHISSHYAAPLHVLKTMQICSASPSPVSYVRHMTKSLWQLLSFHNEGNVLTRKHREINPYPLNFAIHFSSLCALKIEFPGMKLYIRILSSVLFSTSRTPGGHWVQITTAFKQPGQSSKAPTFARDFPSFLDFPNIG